jgi:hypothetical protein
MIDLDQLERDIAAMNAELTVPTVAAMQHYLLLQAKILNMLSHHPCAGFLRESPPRKDSP